MSKIKTWVDLPPKDLTWSEAMLEVEGVVNEEISRLMKKRTDQSKELACLLYTSPSPRD